MITAVLALLVIAALASATFLVFSDTAKGLGMMIAFAVLVFSGVGITFILSVKGVAP